jgi:hypothetical protein
VGGWCGLDSGACEADLNLDRETRCFHATGACVITGNEWLVPGVGYADLGLAVSLFGPPASTYYGPYPTKEKALALVRSAPDQELDRFMHGEVNVREQNFKLPKDLIKGQSFYRDRDLCFRIRFL